MRVQPSLILPLLAAVLAFSACATPPAIAPDSPAVILRGHRFSVDVASTPAEQAHGLMGRTRMAANHGMLFVFADSQPRTFWMKNTLIPLDMLFFDDAHRLVAIQQDVPPCKTDPCAVYPSVVPARYVLELNAGTAARLGVHKGDTISFSDLSSGIQ